MGSVQKALAYAKKAGLELIVQLRISQLFHVCQIVQTMENSIHIRKNAFAMQNIVETIVQWNCAI
jgi:hypothetical protein